MFSKLKIDDITLILIYESFQYSSSWTKSLFLKSDVVLLWKQGSRIIFAGDIKVRKVLPVLLSSTTYSLLSLVLSCSNFFLSLSANFHQKSKLQIFFHNTSFNDEKLLKTTSSSGFSFILYYIHNLNFFLFNIFKLKIELRKSNLCKR